MTDLEIAVRTIEEMLPELSTKQLQKWQGVLRSALVKVEKELTNTYLHTCKICFYQEYGYRDELPNSWYKKGDADICFKHEYAESEKLLKEAGHEVNAFLPPEVPASTTGSLKTLMKNLPPPKPEAEKTLEELMDLL